MWFRKKNGIESEVTERKLSDKAVGWLVNIFLAAQIKFTQVMGRIFNKRSLKSQKLLAGFFCLIAGGISGVVFVNAVTSNPAQQHAISIDHTSVPQHVDQSGEEGNNDVLVDEYTIQQIELFENGMDSIRMADLQKHDSILQVRPGLMDSIKFLKQLYYQQGKK